MIITTVNSTLLFRVVGDETLSVDSVLHVYQHIVLGYTVYCCHVNIRNICD